jgi:putative phosphoribosyl transferase
MAHQLHDKKQMLGLAMDQVAARMRVGKIELAADVSVPDRATGLVLFAHGSGSGRHSPRNRHVADVLNRGAIGTVLADLLTEQEEGVDIQTAELRFDIPLLGRRLVGITDWIGRQPVLKNLGLGYFGASTGAAAALVAAAERPKTVRAVVSRGGRPDLAGAALKGVLAPTLFIVGAEDTVVLDLNYSAMAQLPHQTEHKLEVIPGATHLFEEPGALDRVASLARDWFRERLERKP